MIKELNGENFDMVANLLMTYPRPVNTVIYCKDTDTIKKFYETFRHKGLTENKWFKGTNCFKYTTSHGNHIVIMIPNSKNRRYYGGKGNIVIFDNTFTHKEVTEQIVPTRWFSPDFGVFSFDKDFLEENVFIGRNGNG